MEFEFVFDDILKNNTEVFLLKNMKNGKRRIWYRKSK